MARIGIVLPSGRITCIPGVYPNGDGSPLAPAPVSGGGGGGGGGPVLPLQHIDPWIIDAQFTAQSMDRIFAAKPNMLGYPLLYNHGTDTLDAFGTGFGDAAPDHNWTSSVDQVQVATSATTVFACITGDYKSNSDIGVYSCPIGGNEWTFMFSLDEFMASAYAIPGDPTNVYISNSSGSWAQMLGDGNGDLWLSVILSHIGEGTQALGVPGCSAVLHYSDGAWTLAWHGPWDPSLSNAQIGFGGPNGTFPYIVDTASSVFQIWDGSAFVPFVLPTDSAAFALYNAMRAPLYVVSPTDIWYAEPTDPWGSAPVATVFHHYQNGTVTSFTLDAGNGFVSDGNMWPIQEGILLFNAISHNGVAILVPGDAPQMGPVTLTQVPLAGSLGIDEVLWVEEKGGSFICRNIPGGGQPFQPSITAEYNGNYTQQDFQINDGDSVSFVYQGPVIDRYGSEIQSITLYPDAVNMFQPGSPCTSTPPSDATTPYYIQILDSHGDLLWTSPTINVTAAPSS